MEAAGTERAGAGRFPIGPALAPNGVGGSSGRVATSVMCAWVSCEGTYAAKQRRAVYSSSTCGTLMVGVWSVSGQSRYVAMAAITRELTCCTCSHLGTRQEEQAASSEQREVIEKVRQVGITCGSSATRASSVSLRFLRQGGGGRKQAGVQ